MTRIDNLDVVLLFFALILGAIGLLLLKETFRHVYKYKQRIGPFILSLGLMYLSYQLTAWSNLFKLIGNLLNL